MTDSIDRKAKETKSPELQEQEDINNAVKIIPSLFILQYFDNQYHNNEKVANLLFSLGLFIKL